MRLLMPLCALWLLTSCATTKPVGSLGLHEVAAPVAVACVDLAEIPPLPLTAMRPDADVAARAAGADADIRELRRLVRRQRALLLGCAQSPGGK